MTRKPHEHARKGVNPEQVDWHNKQKLKNAYEEHNGNVKAVARHFGIDEETARKHLARHDIHEVTDALEDYLLEIPREEIHLHFEGLSPLPAKTPSRNGNPETVLCDGGTPAPDAGGDE